MYKHKVHWKTSDYTTLTCPSLPPWSGTCVGVAKHKIQRTNTKYTRTQVITPLWLLPPHPAHNMDTSQHFRILVLVLWNTKYNVQTQNTMHKHKVQCTNTKYTRLENATIYEWLAANRRLRDVCILATWPNSSRYNTIPGTSTDQAIVLTSTKNIFLCQILISLLNQYCVTTAVRHHHCTYVTQLLPINCNILAQALCDRFWSFLFRF